MDHYFFISNNHNMLRSIKERAHWIILLGVLLIILGSLAVTFAFASTLLSVIVLGALLFASGIIEGAKSCTVQRWSTFFLHILLSILYVFAGIYMMLYPALTAINLTLLFAILFVMSGIFKIFFALVKTPPHSMWLFFNGIISILLGILIWQQWPFAGLWALGVFLGIDLVFTGLTWVMLGIAAKNIR